MQPADKHSDPWPGFRLYVKAELRQGRIVSVLPHWLWLRVAVW